MASITVDQKISAAYVAFFQRSPDQTGLDFWKKEAATATEAGKTDLDVLKAIAGGFAKHPTFADLYKGLGNASFIDQIYLNIGGKAADANGKAYWKGLLDGGLTRSDFVASYIDLLLTISEADLAAQVTAGKITAAEKTDALSRQNTLLNKSEVALKFTNAMGSGSNFAAGTDPLDPVSLAKDPVYQASKAIIAGVTDAAASTTGPLDYLKGSPTAAGINAQFGTDSVAPVVTAAQTFSYAENQAAGAVVATVAATDNKAVTGYEIKSGDTAGLYAIDATGKITLTTAGLASAANNFEVAPNTVTLGVVAKDAAGNVSAVTNVVLNETNVGEFTTATGNTTTVKLNFDSALKANTDLAASAFKVVDASNNNIVVSSVNVSGSQVTLTLLTAAQGGSATVSYTAPATGGLADAAGNVIASLTGKTVTFDSVAPALSSSNAGTIAATADLTLVFSEVVTVGTGNIVLTNAANAADTRTIDVTSSQVTLSLDGKTLIINPTADLTVGATYSVAVPATAVKDLAGNAYAGGTLSYSVAAVVTPGQTFVLVKDVIDNIIGTSGDDIILGDNTTTSVGDQVNGGAGNDTLKLYGSATKPVISNVENIYLNAPGAAFDASTIAGVTSLEVDAETGTRTFTVTTGQKVTLSNLQTTGQIQTIAGNTPTSIDLTVNKVGKTDASVTQTVDLSGTALTTLNLKTATADSAITLTNTGAKLATLNVTGDKAVVITEALAALKTIDANASSGNVTIKAGGSANDIKFTGGSGNDAIWFNVGEFNSLDVLNAGAGTGDKLVIAETAGLSATQYAAINGYQGFEVLGLNASGVSVDASKLTAGIKDFAIESGNYTATVTESLATTKYSVDNTAGNIGTLTITNKTGENTTSVAIDNQSGAAQTLATVVTSGIANVNLSSTGKVNSTNTLATLTNADNSNIVVTGDRDLTITSALTVAATGSKVDGNAFTGKLSVVGSAQSDILIGGTAADTLNGGAVTHTVATVTAVKEVFVATFGATVDADTVAFDGVSQALTGSQTGTQNALQYATAYNLVGAANFVAVASAATVTFTQKIGSNITDKVTGDFVVTSGGAGADITVTAAAPTTQGVTAVTAVTGSVDTLTGNAGADTFAFSTADVATTAGAVTAVITDFVTGVDKIKVTNGADAGAGSASNFTKATVAASTLTALLTAADTALDGTVDYYVGQVGSDSYLVTDANGTGYTNVIKLTGVALAGIVAADLIA